MENYSFISHNNTDAYFNLASEEYLLKCKEGFYVYIWQNAPSVIIGTNQNAFSEVNLGYTEKEGIKVVRRLTGGGAVYHDLNNVNYTVIAPYNRDEQTFKLFSLPVIEYLKTLGVNAEFSGRNDLTVDGKKISGTAETVYKNRIMHHGTLLFDTDIEKLSKALIPNKLKIESKGIKSVKSRVANIKDLIKATMTIKEFVSGLCEFLKKGLKEECFTAYDIEQINILRKNKYSTYEWNIGGSPKGKNSFEKRLSFGTFSFIFDTENGKIKNPQIFGDFFEKKPIDGLIKKLDGVRLNYEELSNVFADVSEYILNSNTEEIVNSIFE